MNDDLPREIRIAWERGAIFPTRRQLITVVPELAKSVIVGIRRVIVGMASITGPLAHEDRLARIGRHRFELGDRARVIRRAERHDDLTSLTVFT